MATLGPNFHYKQPTYLILLESAPGVTGILMIIIMSFSFTLATHSFRRSVVKLPSPLHHLAGFNAFWYAHHLLVLAYVLLVVHSYFIFLTREWYKKTTWMYLIVPILFYACERIIRKVRENNYRVSIVKDLHSGLLVGTGPRRHDSQRLWELDWLRLPSSTLASLASSSPASASAASSTATFA
uniref:Uncharacterized protein n=1 Tax=Arundo donax TaxID=35708 RepID=A0A0A9FXC9_ARUDO